MRCQNKRSPTCHVPPSGGWGLGAILATVIAVVVFLVMGSAAVIQEVVALRKEHRVIREDMKRSVVPLAAEVASAPSDSLAIAAVLRFHAAHVAGGIREHHLELLDRNGKVLVSTVPESRRGFDALETIVLPVAAQNPTVNSAALALHEDNPSYRDLVRTRRKHWAIHFAATLAATTLLMRLVIRHLVTAPLERLLDGIRLMEMGYWGDIGPVGGAWEIRWLGWRFRTMGLELKKTVDQLLEAEHRGASAVRASSLPREAPTTRHREGGGGDRESRPSGTCQFLERTCRELETADSGSPTAVESARLAMSELAGIAERIGRHDLKIRLENAAASILAPESFERIVHQLTAHTEARTTWFEDMAKSLSELLAQTSVPVVSMSRRIKHAGGVWMKMESKHLTLDQVHDLFALRIIVPTESDCYWTLKLVHNRFRPIPGRFKDYIQSPKTNGYRSIHTCVQDRSGSIFEVQIRSTAMHRVAETGQASHADYKLNQVVPDGKQGVQSSNLRDLFGRESVRGIWM